MSTRIKILFFLILAFSGNANVYAQYNGSNFGLSFSYNYTTTSKLFLQPGSPDPFISGAHDNLDDIYSYSAEIRYRISDPLILGFGIEYLKKTIVKDNFNLSGRRATVTEGYRIFPFELTLYYYLPFSTENFKFFMGGGLGIYSASFIREIYDVTAENRNSKLGYGLHVVVGMDYMILPYLSVKGQLRFRDPEVRMESIYSSDIVHFNGASVKLRSDQFSTKVNVDGITFVIGAALHFNFRDLLSF